MLLNIMLGSLITSKTRLRMLIKFFISAANNGYLNGLANEFNESTNSIRKELNNLSSAGYLLKTKENNRIIYNANTSHPMFEVLQKIVRQHLGLEDIVEKPDETVRSNWGEPWVSMNIWKLDYDTVLPVLRKTPMNLQRQEHELPTSMRMLAQKTDIFCYYSNASVPDLTSQQDIKRVQEIVHPIDL